MKVALIDNMNNNFFAFARYLRDLEIDANLYEIPNSKMEHFKPEADTFNDISKLKWINKFPCSYKSCIFCNKNTIIKEFKDYDLIISCGLSSAFLKKAGLDSDIIIPYGSDLYEIPFKKINFVLSSDFIKSIFFKYISNFQQKAYKQTRVLITDDGYALYKEALKKLKLSAINAGIPMLYNKENLEVDDNKKIWSFLDKYDFIVFNHSRQYWKSNCEGEALKDFEEFGGLKRNDKLIKAFAKFLKKTKFKNPILILFEYGVDVKESKRLIKELNIEKYIKWMPMMNRKNIMYGLSKATFTSNAFRENKTDIGGVCYESLAMGTLHLNNCIEAINNPMQKFYKSPMIHVLTEEDILNVFIDFEKEPSKYKEIGIKAKEWFDNNLGIGLVKRYVKLMKLMSKNKFLTQNNDIVRDILEGN